MSIIKKNGIRFDFLWGFFFFLVNGVLTIQSHQITNTKKTHTTISDSVCKGLNSQWTP